MAGNLSLTSPEDDFYLVYRYSHCHYDRYLSVFGFGCGERVAAKTLKNKLLQLQL